MENISKILTFILITGFAALAGAMPMDRSTVVPELVRDARVVKTSITDYRVADRVAVNAANRIASDFYYLPKKDRRAARAKAFCQWRASLRIMDARLETLHGTLVRMHVMMGDSLAGGLGKVGERIDGLVTEFSAELQQQERSSAAMEKIYQISPDAIGEAEAQKINHAQDAIMQRRNLLNKFRERRERIATISETIQQKLEGIKAVIGAVEVRMAELKTDAYVVDILIEEDKASLLAEDVLGIAPGEDAGKIFGDGTSKPMDIILNQKTATGISQRELLRHRMGRN